MLKFWKEREKDLKRINANRSQELAIKYFRPYCPVGRMAARIGLYLAVAAVIKSGRGI